ncbi:PAS domain-containing protein [Leptothoe spongobia]|uniref:Circadian input-output histidine kinase CikA n=1 Tax=Leptothoe spongobia TAU-MAC 1115 TaxID=1967444 RepID=A0A947DGM1_9CYAN|nr:PAS domain-containing protein [Leptothoe spongobia]MBT9316697.1 PAS domain-containing protein [Leptothoe spongobia TAU-MAC 1115]
MKLSLRSLIAIPLITQVVVVTAATGWLAYRNNQQAIQELAYQILVETGDHFEHELQHHTTIPTLITQENLDTLELQLLDPTNLEGWFPYLYRQIQRFPEITYIYYGNTQGQYVEINRLPDGDLEFALKADPLDERVKIYPISDNGRVLPAEPKHPYDPRERPWYNVALDHQQARWTNVYDFNDPSPTYGLSFVRPYISDDKLQGVLGADFTLRALETFLTNEQPSRSSVSFLVNADGKILASSEGSSSFKQPQDSASPQQNRQQALVSIAVEQVLHKLESDESLTREQQFKFRVQTENYWVQITPFSDSYGLKWFGVSLLPEADFTSQIRTNNRNTLLLCLLAMGVASGVSLVIARIISNPMGHLGLATQEITRNRAPQCILPSPIHELNLLIDSFNQMEENLAESRAQLEAYSQCLEELVEQRTQSLRQSEATFATTFQASPNAISLSTLNEGRYIKINERFVELIGIPREAVIGRTSTELGIWVEPQTRAIFQRELENQTLRNQEWSFRKPSGEIITVLISAAIIHFKTETCILLIANDIGERIAAQTRLRQSEERWQLALKGNNDGIWDWNLTTNEIFYSARWKEILGYEESEISPNRDEWKSRLHPEDRERVLQATAAHLHQETPYFTEEYRLRCKNGEYIWILDRGQALWDNEGKAIRMTGSHTDISDRKYIEENLRRSQATIQQQEQFLRSIYNSVATGIFVVSVLDDRKFRYIDSNATAEHMAGTSRHALANATPEDLFSPETAAEVINKYQYCVDRGETLTFEENLLINNQSTWWLTTLNPLEDSQGQIYRIIGTTFNITQRRNAEEALAQQVKSEKLLTSLTHQIRQSLDTQKTYETTVDQIGLEFGVSRCCLLIYSEQPKPHIDTVAEYLIPDYRSRGDTEVPILNNAHIRAVLSQDFALVTHDVTEAPLLEAVLPLLDQMQIKSMMTIRTSYQGQPNGVIEIHQCDRKRIWLPWEIELLESVAAQVGIAIAQARLLEQEHTQREALVRQNIALETAIQAAEQASRVKGQFLANMSHELRTPLNAILGFAQIMQRTLQNDPQRFQQESAEHLQIIQNSSDHLLTLINDILDMSKIEAGQINVNLQPFNLHNLLQAIEAMFHARALEKSLTLKCKRAPEVPKYIQTDEAKLRQILINLVDNAIKFTHRGSITIRVWGQQDLQMAVEDTGQGIHPEELDYLFDAFYQAEAGRQTQGGTGLGLAISQTYVKLLGGNLSVNSSLTQGSVFQFTIPITVIEHPNNSMNESYLTVVRLASDQPNYRILVVEDKWASRTLLMKLLESTGFNVRGAANGKDALEIWETWQPHLIWMDMRMPVMDGYEATQRIRSHTRGQATAIIALTASALESEKQIVLSAGCDDFIRKPLQDKIIFEKLQQHLGVKYIYAQQTSSPFHTSDHLPQITPAQLSRQPQAWLQQLNSAASLADAEWVSQLINELPLSDKTLAKALTKLVKGYRCDLIAELSTLSIKQQKS